MRTVKPFTIKFIRRAPPARASARAASAPVFDPQPMPLTAIVNHDGVKAALLVAAVDPACSLIVSGRRGTGKSILCRSVKSLLPRPRVMGADIGAPSFVSVPLGVTEEMVAGTLDINASAKSGLAVFQPGLLALANGGALYIDEINLLDDSILAMIQSSLAEGIARVEREGLSTTMPCECLALASFNPAESELRSHVVDRFAMICGTDDDEGALAQTTTRLAAIDAAMAWQDDWRRVVSDSYTEQKALREHIELAHHVFLPGVQISEANVRRLVKMAVDCACQGHRAELFAVKVARASAALRHSYEVNDQDVNMAISLSILPRATREPPDDALTPPPPPPPPPATQKNEREAEEQQDQEDEEQEEEEEEDQVEEIEPEVQRADESGLDVNSLLNAFEKAMLRSFAEKKSRGSVSGRTKREKVFDLMRGRYVKPIFPKSGQIGGKIAVDATLRAAAPYQIVRRQRRLKPGEVSPRRVFITKDDVRLKKLSRRSASLTIFVVDASGSMAINRMSVAKAAVFKLLEVSYTKRDLVALVEFSHDAAVVLLPPTRSTVLVSRRLAVMPCGGGTPLAHGLSVAARCALNARTSKLKSSVGSVREVILSDGRPTRSLRWSEDPRWRSMEPALTRKALRDEVLEVSIATRRLGFLKTLVVDTDSAFVSEHFCLDIADALGAAYYALPKLEESAFAAFIASIAAR